MKVTWRVTKHEQETSVSSVGLWVSSGGFGLLKVERSCGQLRFWSWTSPLVRLGSWWSCDGGCGGVMVTVHAVLAPLLQQGPACWRWNDITGVGGPLSLFSGALKFCTQRLRGAPISTSQWTQHFWKSLTRLNGGAISCQSEHTGCFSEFT